MDVMIFTFVLPTLIAIWHITKGQAGLLVTSTLIISSAGGWLAGLLADRWGRVKVLQLTILWFAFFTFLSGFTFTFNQLLVVRGLQGLGFGGEWAVGSVLIGETIRSQHRGKAVGTVQGGWAIGWGLAALAYSVLFSVLSPELAWRVMFWIGILPSLLIFYIQSRVHEPEIFSANRELKKTADRAKLPARIFGPKLLRTTLLASLLAHVGSSGRILRNHHMAPPLSEDFTGAFRIGYGCISLRRHFRISSGLSRQRASGGFAWAQTDARFVRSVVSFGGLSVYVAAPKQFRDAYIWIPAGILCFRLP